MCVCCSAGTLIWVPAPDPPPIIDTPISPLNVHVQYWNSSSLRINFTDPVNARWEVPGIVKTEPVNNLQRTLYTFECTTEPAAFTLSVPSRSHNCVGCWGLGVCP